MPFSKENIIFKADFGNFLFGVLDKDINITKVVVFKDSNESLLGFRSKTESTFKRNGAIFIEIGTFIEILYEGSPFAFEVLLTPRYMIETISSEWVMLTRLKDDFVTKNLIKGYFKSFFSLYRKTLKGSSMVEKGGKWELIEDYDKDYACDCFLVLKKCRDVIRFSKIEDKSKDTQLIAVRSGLFSVDSIKKELKILKNQIKELYLSSELPMSPEGAIVNSLLLDIRGTDI